MGEIEIMPWILSDDPHFLWKDVLIIFKNAKLLKKCAWTEQWDWNSGRCDIKESRTNRWKKKASAHTIPSRPTPPETIRMWWNQTVKDNRNRRSNCNNGKDTNCTCRGVTVKTAINKPWASRCLCMHKEPCTHYKICFSHWSVHVR